MAGFGGIALAPSAHAEEVLNCTVGGNTVQLQGNGPFDFENDPDYKCQEVTVANSTVTLADIKVLADTNGDGTFDSDVSASARVGYVNAQTGVRIAYTGASTANQIVAEFKKNITGTPTQTFEITLGSGGGGDTPSGNGGSTDAISGPAPHSQQFAMPATGTCDEAQPEGLNWGGVSSGGWGESWAQWMNDGQGGEVCTRTLVYNASKAAWEVD